MRLSNFIFSTTSSPIPIVESESRHLAKKLFYFAFENYTQIDSAFSIVNESKLSHTITQIVDDSNIDLTTKLENLSTQLVSLQQLIIDLSFSIARISNNSISSSSSNKNSPFSSNKPAPLSKNPPSLILSKPSYSFIASKKSTGSSIYIIEIPTS